MRKPALLVLVFLIAAGAGWFVWNSHVHSEAAAKWDADYTTIRGSFKHVADYKMDYDEDFEPKFHAFSNLLDAFHKTPVPDSASAAKLADMDTCRQTIRDFRRLASQYAIDFQESTRAQLGKTATQVDHCANKGNIDGR